MGTTALWGRSRTVISAAKRERIRKVATTPAPTETARARENLVTFLVSGPADGFFITDTPYVDTLTVKLYSKGGAVIR